MVELKKKDGVYYLYDYTPTRKFRYASEEQIELSKAIWDYKNAEDDAYTEFTNDLMWAVSELCKKISRQNVGLVAVPSSTVGKVNTVVYSIRSMKEWYDEGIAQSHFDCDKKIYDYSTLLERIESLPPAALATPGAKPTVQDHIDTIRANHKSPLWKYRTTFILIDDVTTTGTIMCACKQILLDHGANEDDIICLALARTRK